MISLLSHSFLEHEVQDDSCSFPFLREVDNDIAYFRVATQMGELGTDLLSSSKNSLESQPVLVAHWYIDHIRT